MCALARVSWRADRASPTRRIAHFCAALLNDASGDATALSTIKNDLSRLRGDTIALEKADSKQLDTVRARMQASMDEVSHSASQPARQLARQAAGPALGRPACTAIGQPARCAALNCALLPRD